ncbi:MAG: Gfo/Idh/MocA family protein [Planctomycetota bacterium]|jgi:hypothetical protein
MTEKATRRGFLGTTAAATAAAWVGGKTYAAGAKAGPGPNETVNMALIGCGGRGRGVMREHLGVPGVRVIAVCDVNESRMAPARNEAGGEAVLTVNDYRKVLDNRDIDAVIVGTNGHWHVLPTVDACKAGKDVYVEKPLGTSIGEGRAAVEAAKKYDRVVQIGTQQRSWEHYRRAAEIVRSGKLGEISEVKVWDYDYFYPGFGAPPDGDPPPGLDWDFWVGPSPAQPYNPNKIARHYWFFDFGGGWQLDWAWASPSRFRPWPRAGSCASSSPTTRSGPTPSPAVANTVPGRSPKRASCSSTPSAAAAAGSSGRTASSFSARKAR